MRGDSCISTPSLVIKISIHSPHARGDQFHAKPKDEGFDFNPLPSCEGRPVDYTHQKQLCHFNPLPSCEGRHETQQPEGHPFDFNPLPSCEGRPVPAHCVGATRNFNPLPSCEGRLLFCAKQPKIYLISIHSPHARGDHPSLLPPARHTYFNPLPSCEGRPNDFRYDRR